MANELTLTGIPTGATVYAVVRRVSDDAVYDSTVPGFATFAIVSFANYVVAMAEVPSGSAFWVGNLPAISVTTLAYVTYYRQVGNSPAVTDTVLGGERMYGGGSPADAPVATDGNLITLADYRTFVGDSDSTKDAARNALIAETSQAILNYVGVGLVAANRTEVVWGQGANYLHLGSRPINSIASVTIDPYASTPTSVVPSNFWWDDQGTVRWRSSSSATPGYFPRGTPVQVTYNGGYSSVPQDIKLACCLLVRWSELASDPEVGVTEKVEGNRRIRYAIFITEPTTDPLIGQAQSILSHYKDFVCI